LDAFVQGLVPALTNDPSAIRPLGAQFHEAAHGADLRSPVQQHSLQKGSHRPGWLPFCCLWPHLGGNTVVVKVCRFCRGLWLIGAFFPQSCFSDPSVRDGSVPSILARGATKIDLAVAAMMWEIRNSTAVSN